MTKPNGEKAASVTQVKSNEKTIMIYTLIICSFFLVGIPLNVNAQVVDSTLFDNNARKFDYYFYEALNAKAQGNYSEALDLFLHCNELDSTNANVLVELGTFYNVMEEKEKALEYYKKAVHYDKNNYYYNMMLAGLSRDLNLHQEVVDIFKYMRELNPDKPELLFELANAYADNEEIEKAIESLDELEKSLGVSEALALNKFRLYSMIDNKEKAYEEIEHIIEKNPGDQRYLLLMGDILMEDNQRDKALEYYQKAKIIDPDFPPLILSMVNYYERTGNSKAAQTELTNAITNTVMEVDTKLELLTRYLAVLQQNDQDLKQANILFESLFEQHPNNTQINLIYGNVLSLQNDYEKAVNQFEIFIEDNPDNPGGYEQIIRVALPKEDFDKVKEITTRALEHLPQEAQFYYYLGAVNYQNGNYKEALRVFEEGLENAVFNNPILESDFHGQIGDLNYFLDNKQAAFENYEKALKLNPQNLPVLNNYSYYLSLEKKDLDRAEKMSSITVKAEPLNPTYLDTYGWILYEQGSYIMAKIYIEKAIEYENEPRLMFMSTMEMYYLKPGKRRKRLSNGKEPESLEATQKN